MTWLATRPHDEPAEGAGDLADVTRMRVPLTVTLGLWAAVACAAVAVGGFAWQAGDTRERQGALEREWASGRTQDAEQQARIAERLGSIDTNVARIDERLKAIERRQWRGPGEGGT